MIDEIKHTITKWLLDVISNEWIWFWEWNKEKNKFSLKLTPDLLEDYSEVEWLTTETGFNYYWVEESFFKHLDRLVNLWLIDWYDLEQFSDFKYDFDEYSKDRKKFYDEEDNFKQFENICREKCWLYIISFTPDKINLFNEIVFNSKKLKLNISKQLFKTIIIIYNNFKAKDNYDVFDSNPVQKNELELDIFDLDIIYDNLSMLDEKYVFYDFEILLYVLSIHDTKEFMAIFLDYLLNNLKWEYKDTLVNILKKEAIFHYYTDEEINGSEEAINLLYDNDEHDLNINWAMLQNSIIKDRMIWNLWYYIEDIKEKEQDIVINNTNRFIFYNSNKSMLEYNWIKIPFNDSVISAKLIEELYNNLWQWITKTDLKKKWFKSNIKSTKDNIFKNNFKALSVVEKKKLINFFTSGNEEYIMMVWIEK